MLLLLRLVMHDLHVRFSRYSSCFTASIVALHVCATGGRRQVDASVATIHAAGASFIVRSTAARAGYRS